MKTIRYRSALLLLSTTHRRAVGSVVGFNRILRHVAPVAAFIPRMPGIGPHEMRELGRQVGEANKVTT